MEKFNQSARRSFPVAFAHLNEITKNLTLNRIRFLLTNLAISDEYALNFDAGEAAKARALYPELFPDKKTKGQFGATVYFKYILPTSTT
jgi:hypothetical protein